jgi:hypothetical protein
MFKKLYYCEFVEDKGRAKIEHSNFFFISNSLLLEKNKIYILFHKFLPVRDNKKTKSSYNNTKMHGNTG